VKLRHLAARDFRNLASLDLDAGARFVVFHGENAQGKTNALEAIWLLATLRPLRTRSPRDLVRWGAADGVVSGLVEADGIARRYRVDLGGGTRKVSVDGRTVGDLGEYFAGIRAIAFTPHDVAVVTDEPLERRRWLDRAAFTARPAHLDVARAYRRALEQKAAALRGGHNDGVLDVLDEQVARLGGELAERREALLVELTPHVGAVHQRIAGGSGRLVLTYRTEAVGADAASRVAALRARLAAVRDEEKRRQRTLVGPQTDDVAIELDGRSARAFGSQGQVRSIVLALKLGELVAARGRGDAPMFLLDDVGSELDAGRTARLVDLLGELAVQVIATTTNPAHLGALPLSDTLLVKIEGGVATPGARASDA